MGAGFFVESVGEMGPRIMFVVLSENIVVTPVAVCQPTFSRNSSTASVSAGFTGYLQIQEDPEPQ
ncbi:hypothetical protein AAG906_002313 [Vitis piasezkii]